MSKAHLVLALAVFAAIAAAFGATPAKLLAARDIADPQSAEATLCRSIAVVLNQGETRIRVISSEATQGGEVLVVRYVVDAEGKRSSGRTLVCAFTGDGKPFGKPREIVAVTHDGRPLGPARLALLQRYWLKSDEARKSGKALPVFGEK